MESALLLRVAKKGIRMFANSSTNTVLEMDYCIIQMERYNKLYS
jgi:hypothetical protein